MYFGATTFAEDCFGAQGVPNTIVEVSGIALAMNSGSSTITGDANVTATGISVTFSIGQVSIQTDVSFAVTGSELTLSLHINGVAWETVDIGTAQTYSDVSTGSSDMD